MTGDEATSAFAGDPQPVEVYHRGIWYLGELLGWRHGSDGRCLARVRCVVDGLRHSAWKDLADLRLPEPIGYDDQDADLAPDGEDDATRPHVLLADLRTRPRPPAHALVPPPRWKPADARPAVLTAPPAPSAPAAAEPAQAPAAVETPAAPAPGRDSGNWTHLRRGGRLSKV